MLGRQRLEARNEDLDLPGRGEQDHRVVSRMSSAGALLRVGKKKITGLGEPEPEVPAALLRPAPLRTCLKPRTSRWATSSSYQVATHVDAVAQIPRYCRRALLVVGSGVHRR